MNPFKRKWLALFSMTVILTLLLVCNVALAAGITLNVPGSAVVPGGNIQISGTATDIAPGTSIGITIKNPSNGVFVVDQTKTGTEGYSFQFTLPADAPTGTWTVDVAGGGSASSASFNVTASSGSEENGGDSGGGSGGSGGGGGGGSSPSQSVSSTSGSASVTPGAGGKVGLGGEASVAIPAGALQGNSAVKVTVQKVNSPPAAPSGFMVLGSVYEFKVGESESYSFNKPVTLTFTINPSKLAPGATPAVYYYDETNGQWVNIGGTVSGQTITVTVNHFTKYAVMEKAAAPIKETTQPPSVTLTDIAGHWAEKNILQLAGLGAIGGYSDGTFKPNNNITRAEFVTVLVKAFKLQQQDGGKVFSDTTNHWAKDNIATATFYGIVSGLGETSFGPNEPITREQMSVMIGNAAKPSPASVQPSYKDNASISAWAKESVAAVVQKGIMNGYPDATFRPKNYATRAEAVTVITNALK